MDSSSVSTASVQHVSKKSSDELLSKFAELGEKCESNTKRKRRRKIWVGAEADQNENLFTNSTRLVENRSLLPPAVTRKSVLLRRIGIGKSQLRARDTIYRNRSLFVTIEKTWRRTIEGASKVFIEKHYHRHKRLINDIV